MTMYHRHSNETIRQSRPFDCVRNPLSYPERLPLRPDDRNHHHHHHHHHQQQQQQPPQHHYSSHHTDQRRSYHHDSNPPRSSSNLQSTDHSRFHSSSDRLSRSQNSAPSRPIDRRVDYPERSIQRPSQSSQHLDNNYDDSRRIYDEPRTSAKVYDDKNRDGHNTSLAGPNSHNPNSSINLSGASNNSHRRSDDFPVSSRSTRYAPYPPPSGPRADSHLPSSMSRIPHGPSGHAPYHSSSGNVPSTYDDRLPHSRNHDHAPQRTFDPNSQFNHGPPKDKSPPSQSVIFMGLPIHTDEANLRAFLEECGASVDSVTIIYDRITGQSKRYGFARFVSVEHARAFVEPAFPMVVWKEPSGSRHDNIGDGLKVKIDYSQKEKVPFEVRQRERDVVAPARNTPATPFITEIPSQSGFSHNSSDSSSAINDGARDIGGTPTSILLLRGLDPLSTEEEIAQTLQHIPDPSQTVLPHSVRKVMLIKDRQTRASWGYAFVQFAEVQVAVKALSLLLNTSLFPRGFQIKSRTITVTFAHEHSFHPIYTPSDWSFKGAGGQELAYWDDKAYAALYISTIAEPNSSLLPNNTKTLSQPDQAEESRNGHHEDADVNELLSSIDAEPQVNSNKQGALTNEAENPSKHSSKSHTRSNAQATTGEKSQSSEKRMIENEKVEHKAQAENKNVVGEAGINHIETIHSIPKGSEGSKNEKKKTSAEPIATKKMVANIQKWQSKHQEIATSAPVEEVKTQPIQSSNENSTVGSGDEFSDFTRLTCVLCQRQFKSPIDLQRHNSLSNLHKTNLQDEKLKKLARSKKAASLTKKANNPTTASSTGTTNTPTVPAESGPKYTDRAAARREAYGQPDAPNADKHEAKKARYEPAPPSVLPPAQPDKDGIQDTNVGSKMLEKMGWQKGEGLGTSTNGRVDPVVAAQYTKGVGLGAATGVAVGQYEDSKKGFLEQVKDKTVQRFNQD